MENNCLPEAFLFFALSHQWRVLLGCCGSTTATENGNIEYGPGKRPTKESLARAYEYWNGYIKENVNASQLLLHNAKDGWEPLCMHLDIPEDACPTDEPYPHMNEKSVWRVIVALEYACSRIHGHIA